MSSLCIFGGHDSNLTTGGGIHVTIFAGSDHKRPPVAQLLAQSRQRGGQGVDLGRHTFFTVFAGASVVWPTLAQEYLALAEGLRGGNLTLEEWDQFVAGPEACLVHVHAITLFGGFDDNEVPSEDDEIDDLSLQRHLGYIPEEAVDVLMHAVGQAGARRLSAVREAVRAAMSSAS